MFLQNINNPLDVLIDTFQEDPFTFLLVVVLWAFTGMFTFWAIIKKENIDKRLIIILFLGIAVALFFLALYKSPAMSSLIQTDFIAFIGVFAGTAIFGAFFLPAIMIMFLTMGVGLSQGRS